MPILHARSIVWLRRDLRLADNVALERAARESERVVCAFVLDPKLLRSDRMGAAIVSFFFDALGELRATLRKRKSDLALLEGDFAEQLTALARRIDASAIYYNRDVEPAAISRDRDVRTHLERAGAKVIETLDTTYFGAREIEQATGKAYTVFFPYKRRWLERYEAEPRAPVDSLYAIEGKLLASAEIGTTREVPEPSEYGYERGKHFPRGGEGKAHELLDAFVAERIGAYEAKRNEPAIDGTSYLSPHLRAGTIGIRTCVFAARDARERVRGNSSAALGIDTWLSELIWRDFYSQILANYPHVATEPFVEAAKKLRYNEPGDEWRAWCDGTTGYPIVDAAMRQLNATGWMHNRARMIVASFLTKDLLLDYRLGERYFEQHLADADLAANNGGWQWSSSTGTDAAPYFRVFNPTLQSEKFDPSGAYIKRWVPELNAVEGRAIHAPWLLSPIEQEAAKVRIGRDYPAPIVDHKQARERALATFGPVLGKSARRTPMEDAVKS
jgi:deoxyribodipyrimidine photo-lyase